MFKMLMMIIILLGMTTQMEGCSLDDMVAEISYNETASQIASLKADLEQRIRDAAWYSLHTAAAAACRGSTATGGSGNHFNVVLPKENTASCHDQCARTEFTHCDADVAIQGGFGKATSYTQIVAQFYNYGCEGAGNTKELFDEVKANQYGVRTLDPNVEERQGGARYYRFCCCRY